MLCKYFFVLLTIKRQSDYISSTDALFSFLTLHHTRESHITKTYHVHIILSLDMVSCDANLFLLRCPDPNGVVQTEMV